MSMLSWWLKIKRQFYLYQQYHIVKNLHKIVWICSDAVNPLLAVIDLFQELGAKVNKPTTSYIFIQSQHFIATACFYF